MGLRRMNRRAFEVMLSLCGILFLSCASAEPPPEPSVDAGGEVMIHVGDDIEVDCATPPIAYVLEPEGGRAKELLDVAGFEVRDLPLNASPGYLQGLIWIGSYASDMPEYAAFMETYAADLYAFVDRANVLVQMAQSAATEPTPPFFPQSHDATRNDGDVAYAHVVTPESPLLAEAPAHDGRLDNTTSTVAAHAFASQSGFEVVLAADEGGRVPLLMEGAYGQGRFIVSSLSFDAAGGPALDAFATTFTERLVGHTTAVCNRRTTAIGVTDYTEDVVFQGDSFILAVLPDTQFYSLRFPGLLHAQTGWIASNARRLGIRYVMQLGDIVNNNTDLEWEHAAEGFSVLDGVVPYAIVPGNHDFGPSGDASNRDTGLNAYFSFETAAAMPTFGGAFVDGELNNTFHLFSAGGRDFIIIALEWGPRDEVVAWANEVMEQHPNRWGIMITHAYLNNNDLRYDHTDTVNPQDFNPHAYRTPGTKNDGEQLWQKLIRHHRFVMVLNGHVLGDGTGYLASRTDLGHTCHQMLANYQMRELGGEGYLRLLEFSNNGRSVRVLTYSPLYDRYLEDADQTFSFDLDIQ